MTDLALGAQNVSPLLGATAPLPPGGARVPPAEASAPAGNRGRRGAAISPKMFVLGYRATPATLAVGAQALARIWFPWRELLANWSLRFLPQRPGYLGRTLWPDRAIEIYVRPGQPVEDVAFALAHELGHAVDLEHFDPAARGRWRQARALPASVPWFGESDANDFATPAGDWAECFAAWQVGAGLFQSQLGPAPDDAQLDTLQSLALGDWFVGMAPRPGHGGAGPEIGTKDLQTASVRTDAQVAQTRMSTPPGERRIKEDL